MLHLLFMILKEQSDGGARVHELWLFTLFALANRLPTYLAIQKKQG